MPKGRQARTRVATCPPPDEPAPDTQALASMAVMYVAAKIMQIGTAPRLPSRPACRTERLILAAAAAGQRQSFSAI